VFSRIREAGVWGAAVLSMLVYAVFNMRETWSQQ
jgi:hypothetical protein